MCKGAENKPDMEPLGLCRFLSSTLSRVFHVVGHSEKEIKRRNFEEPGANRQNAECLKVTENNYKRCHLLFLQMSSCITLRLNSNSTTFFPRVGVFVNGVQ